MCSRTASSDVSAYGAAVRRIFTVLLAGPGLPADEDRRILLATASYSFGVSTAVLFAVAQVLIRGQAHQGDPMRPMRGLATRTTDRTAPRQVAIRGIGKGHGASPACDPEGLWRRKPYGEAESQAKRLHVSQAGGRDAHAAHRHGPLQRAADRAERPVDINRCLGCDVGAASFRAVELQQDRDRHHHSVMRKESAMRNTIILLAALTIAGAGISFAADGAALFKQHCASCHGATGKADTPVSKALNVPALAGDAKVAGMSDADVIAKIKENPKHASVLKTVTDDDLAALATYVKGLAAAK
jgi:cytochrome c553